MPSHRTARRDSADIVKAGASANTSGIGVVRAAIPNRGVQNGDLFHISHDGVTAQHVLDGTWYSKTITDSAATSLVDIGFANSTIAGGNLHYLVEASDGTDFQAISGMVTYAAVDKAGTKTLTITDLSTTNAKAVSSGTLTLAWTFVTGTLKGTIKLQPTGSLTETTPYRVTFFVMPIRGSVTVI